MLEDIIITITTIFIIIIIVSLAMIIKDLLAQVLELSAWKRSCLPALKLPFVLRLVLPVIMVLIFGDSDDNDFCCPVSLHQR